LRSFACLALSNSCLSRIAKISGMSMAGYLIRLSRELEAFYTEPSLTLMMLRPDSRLCFSRRN
jgi:hypothetical protein